MKTQISLMAKRISQVSMSILLLCREQIGKHPHIKHIESSVFHRRVENGIAKVMKAKTDRELNEIKQDMHGERKEGEQRKDRGTEMKCKGETRRQR